MSNVKIKFLAMSHVNFECLCRANFGLNVVCRMKKWANVACRNKAFMGPPNASRISTLENDLFMEKYGLPQHL